MENIKERLIQIHSCSGVGWKLIFKFFQYDSTLQTIFLLKQHDFPQLFHMNPHQSQLFYNDLHSTSFQKQIDQYKREGIEIITIFDADYPALLKGIYDPPWVLYSKGKKLLLESNCIGVVGTRKPSQYGYQAVKALLPPLIQKNWTIVSGLAIGIDTAAHKIAIIENGYTIAVLGSGFYHIYPSQNRNLADYLSMNHLLLSEFPPNKKPEKWHFPLRNRIISGLSKGTLIVEAKDRSGSLITADQALEQGREVFAVPGSIFEPTNQGTNRLIQQGAKLVLNSSDILTEI
ncbi:DNA-processing protein DprA [Bacillus sp. Marseille-P3661]|uniref:DNA-processing protein DprA n=1 Tax=Bacillus sp. Marseille-P3661 TaxID=1936234 RepID=UPI000C819F97|nr:DNA-processing protein DprA [Bacillus sp. Marseille-P3661]